MSKLHPELWAYNLNPAKPFIDISSSMGIKKGEGNLPFCTSFCTS